MSPSSSPSSSERQPLLNSSGPTNGNNGTIENHTTRNDDDDNAVSDTEKEPSNLHLLAILSGVYLGAIACAIDGTLVATLSASISNSFSDLPLLSWLASAFFIASAASQPVAGKLTDIYGRRNGFLFASAILVLGNLLCAIAQEEWVLLLGRIVAGIGGGAISPIVSFILSDIIPLRRRGVWQGIGNVGFGVGSGIGGPFGGWLNDLSNWRWAFAAQIPITLVSMVLIVWKLESPHDPAGSGPQPLATTNGETGVESGVESHKNKFRRIDFVGALLLTASIVLLLLGLTSGGNLVAWTHPLVLASLPVSVVSLIAFALFEHYRATEPVIPVGLLAHRTVAAVCLSNWFISMARFGMLFYGPIYFQIQGYTPAQTGLRFIPESIATAVTSISCGLIMRATGRYYALSIGVQIMTPIGLALMSTLTLNSPAWPPFIFLFLVGLGYSGMLTTTLLALLSAVEQTHVAVMTSASYAFRTTGTVIGIALASAVFQNALRPELERRLGHLENGSELIRDVEGSLSKALELPEPLRGYVQDAYMNALHAVFFTLLGLAVLGVVSATFMREHRLHSKLSRRPSDSE